MSVHGSEPADTSDPNPDSAKALDGWLAAASAAVRSRRRVVRWLPAAIVVPLAVAGLWAALAYAASLVALLAGAGDVQLGFAEAVVADAAAWRFADRPLYDALPRGYAGLPYTPGLPIVVGLLMGLWPWNGWPLVLTMLAGLALMPLGVVAVRAGGGARSGSGRSEVMGRPPLVRALAYLAATMHLVWLPLVLPLPLLHEGRADLPALVLGMAAVVWLDRSLAGDRGWHGGAVAGLLAAGAFAFKQTALVAVVAGAVAVLLVGSRLPTAASRRARQGAFGGRWAVGWRAGRRPMRERRAFLLAATGGIGLLTLLIAVDSGRRGLAAVYGDGLAFDAALTWPEAIVWTSAALLPVLLAWGLAHVVCAGAPGSRECCRLIGRQPALYTLLPLSALAGLSLFRYDGADWNAYLFLALALGWTALAAVRSAAGRGQRGRAAAALLGLAVAAAVSPAWGRAVAPSEPPGFPRAEPGSLARPFTVVRHARRMSLRAALDAQAVSRICGADAVRTAAASSGDVAAPASVYDPRLPYRDALRTGRIQPGIIGLLDHYAIGRGPAAPLIEALRAGRFACVVEGELLARPAWERYVGGAVRSGDPARDFDAVRRALEAGYRPSTRWHEGRQVWLRR